MLFRLVFSYSFKNASIFFSFQGGICLLSAPTFLAFLLPRGGYMPSFCPTFLAFSPSKGGYMPSFCPTFLAFSPSKGDIYLLSTPLFLLFYLPRGDMSSFCPTLIRYQPASYLYILPDFHNNRPTVLRNHHFTSHLVQSLQCLRVRMSVAVSFLTGDNG